MERQSGRIAEIVAKEIIPRFANLIGALWRDGTLTIDSYLPAFKQVVKGAFRRHRWDLQIGFKRFRDTVKVDFEDQIREARQEIFESRDPVEFLRWQEDRLRQSSAATDKQQQLYHGSIQRLGDEIIKSRHLCEHASGLARRLQGVKKLPLTNPVEAERHVWDVAFLALHDKAGPGTRSDGRWRGVDDVFEFGFLSNESRNEFQDDAQIGEKPAVLHADVDVAVGSDDPHDRELDRMATERLLAHIDRLEPEEREVVIGWMENESQKERGQRLGLSQSSTHRMEKRAFDRLRSNMT